MPRESQKNPDEDFEEERDPEFPGFPQIIEGASKNPFKIDPDNEPLIGFVLHPIDIEDIFDNSNYGDI